MDKNINQENLVSIILPTYNGVKRIKEAIESVLKQSYVNWELLVIDDASNDNTGEIVKSLGYADKRIIYIRNAENLGIQKSLNKGLGEARGEYIARIDDDDVWIDSDKLKHQVEFLKKNDDHVLVGTGFIAVDEKNNEIFRRINPESDKDIRKIILNKNCFLHSSVVFIRSVALQYGGYSEAENTKHIEDYDLWLKLGVVGKLANIPTHSVKLALRIGSISSDNKVVQFKKCIQLIAKYKNNYPNYTFAKISLAVRMAVYMLLQVKPFNYFYKAIYGFYKNI